MQPQSVQIEILFQLIGQLTVEKAMLLQQIQNLANGGDKKLSDAVEGGSLSNGYDENGQARATGLLEGNRQGPRS